METRLSFASASNLDYELPLFLVCRAKATFVSRARTLPSLNRKKKRDFSQSTSISDNLTEAEEIENFSEESSRLRLSL